MIYKRIEEQCAQIFAPLEKRRFSASHCNISTCKRSISTIFCIQEHRLIAVGVKNVTPPQMPKNRQSFLNKPFSKLQSSMIAQNDRYKILSYFNFQDFFPGRLGKLRNGKKVIAKTWV